jgi:DNA polymerase III subunit gamma/tau
MSHTALYRKYRPEKFEEVVGQDHVVTAVTGAIEKDKVAHAYLFSGSRGIGKTSIARIFAREIGTTENDLYEIDAASNRGIDDIRAIREAVNTLPFESKYKVYIVDEVHMLTKEAFNALLKTLEEPPAHVVFILATTEIEKLPDTIVSRCQTFDFKKPSASTLSDVVKDIAKKEGCTIDDKVADLIGRAGNGAYRDTLGILQKVMSSSSDKKITFEDTEEILGTPPIQNIQTYLKAFFEGDTESGISALQKSSENGVNMTLFGEMVLERLRAVLMLRFVPTKSEDIKKDFGDEFSVIENMSQNKEYKLDSQKMIDVIEAVELSKRSSISELPLELLLIREN